MSPDGHRFLIIFMPILIPDQLCWCYTLMSFSFTDSCLAPVVLNFIGATPWNIYVE